MTDTSDLREQIAKALAEKDGYVWLGDSDDEQPLRRATYLARAAAVLAVLPEGFDRFVSTIELLRDRLADTTRERDEAWDSLQRMEEENDQLRLERKRLRREVEFEANGSGTFAGADAVAERGEIGVAFVAEDFGLDVDYEAGGVYVSLNHSPVARTEPWGDDVNVDYDADGTPTGVEILRPPRVHPDSNGGAEST